jgi:hypothetical protein
MTVCIPKLLPLPLFTLYSTAFRGTALNYYVLTFMKVEFDTGTNFPAVSVNSLLAVAMMKARQR